jgi:hypothetical protein
MAGTSIRILLPSPKFDEEDIPSNINSNISTKYFDAPLGSNEIISILDSELIYFTIICNEPSFYNILISISISCIIPTPTFAATVAKGYDNRSCNCVVFRLDDMQDYQINNTQILLMDTFLTED